MKISELKRPLVETSYSRDDLKIISGGQTGADQAALSTALNFKIQTGGWMPKGWKTLDGPRPEFEQIYKMKEAEQAGYPARTELNVKDADLTLRFATDFSSPGEKCTLNALLKHKKPYVDFNVHAELTKSNAIKIADFIMANGFQTINVAGNTEKTSPKIGEKVNEFLYIVFFLLTQNPTIGEHYAYQK